MKHTLETLLKMAQTPEGIIEIHKTIAVLSGVSYTYYHVPFQLVTKAGKSGWNNYPCGLSKARAEAKRSELLADGDEVGEIVGVEKPELLPDYTTSLDAMAGARESLTVGELLQLQKVIQSIIYHTEISTGSPSFAKPITHAIAFILTKQA